MLRIEKLQAKLKQGKIDAVLISDCNAIFYLTNCKFHVGERFIGLLVDRINKPILFLNALFPQAQNEHFIIERFSDSEDILKKVSVKLKAYSNIGIDKMMVAKFTLPLIQELGQQAICLGSHLIDDMRLIKDAEEIEKMRQASALNDKIMGEVEAFIKVGISDKKIEEFIMSCYKKYAVEPSFTPIVAFKNTASDPHASANNQILSDSDVVIIDMGCILNDYCSDMTRSFVYSHPKMQEIYAIVLEANQAAIKAVKPNVKFSDIDKAARDVIDSYGYGAYFTHRCGHGIGLEVHEPMDVSSVNDAYVKEGMCFSIEPGIYLPQAGGIRIEDLVIVSSDGCIVLNQYPK